MKIFLSICAALLLVNGGLYVAYLLLRNKVIDGSYEPRQCWQFSQSNGAPHLMIDTPMTEREALAYLRQTWPMATLDYIDRDWNVIFYRIGR